MIKKFSFIKTLPAYALGVCLALSCNTVEPQFADPAPVREISFVPADSQQAGTKGIPVASDNIATLYADNVRIVAFRGRDEYIPSQTLLSPSGENPLWHTAERYFWPESGSLDFWAWAPAGLNAVFDDGHSSLSFSFSLPAPDPDSKQDAPGQQDIVLTRIIADRASYDGGVPLNFSHPLSSIVFRGGTLRDGIIRSITLRGVAGSGECVFDGNGFVWNVSDELLSYTQTFNAPVSASGTGQPITMAGSTNGERTFIMIPQVLGNSASMDIVFDDGSDVRTFSHSLAGSVWEAGTNYTYTISLSPENPEEITVEEDFDGYTKSNLSISNSSGYNIYIRAMIEANWVNADGDIVAPCDINREGTFVGFNISSTGGRWTRHTDGFYYYKKAIRPGRKTVNLFTSYIPGAAPVSGCHLEMTVSAQAVKYETNQRSAREAWGNDIPVTGAIE